MIQPNITDQYDGTYHVAMDCTCGYLTEAMVTGPELFAYRQGVHVQRAFPSLTDAQREALFITGICDSCWDSMFPEEEDN